MKSEVPNPRNPKGPEGRNPNNCSDLYSYSGLGFPYDFDLRASDFYTPRTLQWELDHRGPLPFDECLPLFLSLTSGLGHMHQHGLIHRDIKPSNIIFVSGVAKLAEIGLVSEAGRSDSYVGTEGYIPREGPGTPQADR